VSRDASMTVRRTVKELQKKIDALRKVRVTLNQKTRVH
jgi:hypothetical protein